jgi:peptide/nickel transport system permease protein
MGTLAIKAVRQRDYPTIMVINMIGAVTILMSSLIADVIYAWIDPRINYS